MLLWIVGEIMIMCYVCCWVMLLMMIHAVGITNCVVVIQFVVLWWIFGEMGQNGGISDFIFEWVDDVVRMNKNT